MKKIILYGMTISLLLNTNIVLAAELKEGTGQWVDVSLDDKEPFDENCEYRAKMTMNNHLLSYVQNMRGTFYASSVENTQLYFSLGYSGISNEFAVHTLIQHHEKSKNSAVGNVNGVVTKIEKRCPINLQLFLTPKSLKSLVGLFANGVCPEGWTKTKWPYRKPVEGCSGKSCKMVGVKELPGYIACEKK